MLNGPEPILAESEGTRVNMAHLDLRWDCARCRKRMLVLLEDVAPPEPVLLEDAPPPEP